MPNNLRRSDEMKQEWLKDKSEKGPLSLEVAFSDDDPNGEWTTKVFPVGKNENRLSRGDKTAIVIEGLSSERQRELTDKIHAATAVENARKTQRQLILEALLEDDGLDWVA